MQDAGKGAETFRKGPFTKRKSSGFLLETAISHCKGSFPGDILAPSDVEESFFFFLMFIYF